MTLARRFMLVMLAAAVVLAMSTHFHVVYFHYPRWIDDQPLRSPVRVLCVEPDCLVLEDGRVLFVDPASDSRLARHWHDSENLIDVENVSGDPVHIYASRELVRCGTPWAALIQIPLFQDDVPKCARCSVAVGSG